jgi:hypothetical protein
MECYKVHNAETNRDHLFVFDDQALRYAHYLGVDAETVELTDIGSCRALSSPDHEQETEAFLESLGIPLELTAA